MVPTKKLFTILAILLVILGATVILLENSMIITDSEKTHVACIGDSLTEATNYPRYLQTMLGAGYKVENFGVSGATVLLNSDQPYNGFPRCKKRGTSHRSNHAWNKRCTK
jgi:hypothetical protein